MQILIHTAGACRDMHMGTCRDKHAYTNMNNRGKCRYIHKYADTCRYVYGDIYTYMMYTQ